MYTEQKRERGKEGKRERGKEGKRERGKEGTGRHRRKDKDKITNKKRNNKSNVSILLHWCFVLSIDTITSFEPHTGHHYLVFSTKYRTSAIWN